MAIAYICDKCGNGFAATESDTLLEGRIMITASVKMGGKDCPYGLDLCPKCRAWAYRQIVGELEKQGATPEKG